MGLACESPNKRYLEIEDPRGPLEPGKALESTTVREGERGPGLVFTQGNNSAVLLINCLSKDQA